MSEKPDFMGVWIDESRPARQVAFFMYILNRNGKAISGEIVDPIGISGFIGDMDEEGIRFTKTYVHGDSQNISYFGKKNGENYSGNWDINQQKGTFTLERYPSLRTLDVIANNLRIEKSRFTSHQ